jgi:hypothetical protein
VLTFRPALAHCGIGACHLSSQLMLSFQFGQTCTSTVLAFTELAARDLRLGCYPPIAQWWLLMNFQCGVELGESREDEVD